MKTIKAFIKGFREAYRQKKIVTIIYSITLLLALSIIFPFKTIITNNFELRPQVYKLLGDFDFTVIADLLNSKGNLIYPFVTLFFWIGALYFFFAVFFAGGVLRLMMEKFDAPRGTAFFSGCSKFFFRFLRLGIYILLIQFVSAGFIALLFLIVSLITENGSEPAQFYVPIIWGGIQIVVLCFWLIVSDYAKIILVKDDSKKVWRAIGTGLMFTVKNIFSTCSVFLLSIFLPLLFTLLYLLIDSVIGMKNEITILLMFVLQQLMIWFRFFAKVWLIGGEYNYFEEYYIAKTQPLQTQEIITDEGL